MKATKKIALLFVAAVGFLLASRGQHAVAPSGVGSHPLKFDVASVKLARPDESMRIMPTGDGFVAHSVTAIQLVLFAYHSLDASQPGEGIVKPEQIAGLPGWAKTLRFDFDAKVLSDQADLLQKGTTEQRRAVHQQMLASLLADRFRLVVHYKAGDAPVYALVVKDRSKLRAADPASAGGCNMLFWTGNLHFNDCSVNQLALGLSGQDDVGRIVVDRTGLSGAYEFRLKWAPYNNEESDEGPSLFSALKDQLGLALVSARAPVNNLVVDSIEKPSQD